MKSVCKTAQIFPTKRLLLLTHCATPSSSPAFFPAKRLSYFTHWTIPFKSAKHFPPKDLVIFTHWTVPFKSAKHFRPEDLGFFFTNFQSPYSERYSFPLKDLVFAWFYSSQESTLFFSLNWKISKKRALSFLKKNIYTNEAGKKTIKDSIRQH